MPVRNIERIKQQNLFYRFNYSKVVTAFWFFLVIVFVQLFIMAYLLIFEIEQRYFATSYSGLLYDLQGADEPNFQASVLNEWVVESTNE